MSKILFQALRIIAAIAKNPGDTDADTLKRCQDVAKHAMATYSRKKKKEKRQ